MIDFDKLNSNIRSDIMERLGIENPDKIPACTIREAFEYWCEWNGFIGWSDKILSVVENLQASQIEAKPPKAD